MTVVTEARSVETPSTVELAYKGLIDDELWGRLTNRIIKDHNMERGLAERIMNEALGFLNFCAKAPVDLDNQASLFRPSEMVDIGWHAFLLYTVEYAEFCNRIAGHFIHHKPSDKPGVEYVNFGTMERTIGAMLVFGPVDESLWAESRADCSDHCGSSCTK